MTLHVMCLPVTWQAQLCRRPAVPCLPLYDVLPSRCISMLASVAASSCHVAGTKPQRLTARDAGKLSHSGHLSLIRVSQYASAVLPCFLRKHSRCVQGWEGQHQLTAVCFAGQACGTAACS